MSQVHMPALLLAILRLGITVREHHQIIKTIKFLFAICQCLIEMVRPVQSSPVQSSPRFLKLNATLPTIVRRQLTLLCRKPPLALDEDEDEDDKVQISKPKPLHEIQLPTTKPKWSSFLCL
ncbi:hypothetical protein V6N12_044376 [Hibiscus sabdariffa]|uniref:Uncharacterized protein n=1 Tax=Hibiscus sabdariffa TaxID=183260 RepID=A0ABR2AQ26_9ROSI